MALNIKDEETDRLARELSRATGMSITAAVRDAIKTRLGQVEAVNRVQSRRGKLTKIIARGRARSVLDERSPDEILGYDHAGLPS